MHFHGWRKGLKTGMYYLRTRAAVGAIQFTVSADIQAQAKAQQKTGVSPVPVAAAAVAPVAAIAEVVPVKASPLSPVNNAPKVNGVAEITAGVGKMSTSLVGAGADVTPILKAKEAPKVDLKGEDEDITFEEATRRRKERELEAVKLQCSIDNKESCMRKWPSFSLRARKKANLSCRFQCARVKRSSPPPRGQGPSILLFFRYLLRSQSTLYYYYFHTYFRFVLLSWKISLVRCPVVNLLACKQSLFRSPCNGNFALSYPDTIQEHCFVFGCLLFGCIARMVLELFRVAKLSFGAEAWL